MTIKLQSTAEISLTHGVKCLVYGPTGVGKTRLCASTPNPVIISAESGLLSLRKFSLSAININNYADLVEAYNWCMSSREAAQYKTICLDSISEIAEVVLTEEKRKTKDGRKAYGEMQDQLVIMLRNFRDLAGKHVYFSAKQEFTTDGQTGAKYFAPMFPGTKLAQNVPYFFDEVFQLNAWKDASGAELRYLRTRPDAQNTAKDRSGVLDEWENADPATGGGLTAIFTKMMKG